jgi:uncharacterized Fe-S radical SAM superfamily protein PflX
MELTVNVKYISLFLPDKEYAKIMYGKAVSYITNNIRVASSNDSSKQQRLARNLLTCLFLIPNKLNLCLI